MGQKSDIIIPAIMPKGFSDIATKVEHVYRDVKTVQLDIMDGVYVPGKTFPFLNPDSFWQAIQNEEAGLPFWEEVDYELDLMVKYPEDRLDEWMKLGPSRIIFHVASLRDPKKLIESLQNTREIVAIGLALNNEIPLEILDLYRDTIDFVQVMGIARIGFQGEPLDERVLDRIKTIREKYPKLPISVDGGVNRNTIEMLRNSGADRFAVGSAVWNSEHPGNVIRELATAVS